MTSFNPVVSSTYSVLFLYIYGYKVSVLTFFLSTVSGFLISVPFTNCKHTTNTFARLLCMEYKIRLRPLIWSFPIVVVFFFGGRGGGGGSRSPNPDPLWNNLTEELKHSMSIGHFKRNIKQVSDLSDSLTAIL